MFHTNLTSMQVAVLSCHYIVEIGTVNSLHALTSNGKERKAWFVT